MCVIINVLLHIRYYVLLIADIWYIYAITLALSYAITSCYIYAVICYYTYVVIYDYIILYFKCMLWLQQ